MQLPDWQSLPAEQTWPQLPQLLELVDRFTHAPEHDMKPAAQVVEQAPAMQVEPGQSLLLAQAAGSPALAQRIRPSKRLQAFVLKATGAPAVANQPARLAAAVVPDSRLPFSNEKIVERLTSPAMVAIRTALVTGLPHENVCGEEVTTTATSPVGAPGAPSSSRLLCDAAVP